MRHYEIVFLVHPDQSEQINEIIGRYKTLVTAGQGTVHRTEDWGRRRLAYAINEVHKAHYIMLNIECELKVLQEIEGHFQFNDSILRHLIIRRKQAISEPSAMLEAKEKADARSATASEKSSKPVPTAKPAVAEAARMDEVKAVGADPVTAPVTVPGTNAVEVAAAETAAIETMVPSEVDVASDATDSPATTTPEETK